MTDDKMTVSVNGNEVTLHRGMKVKHALIACDQSLYDAAEAGDLAVRDANGFNVGLDGALRDGAKLFTGKPGEGWQAGDRGRIPGAALRSFAGFVLVKIGRAEVKKSG